MFSTARNVTGRRANDEPVLKLFAWPEIDGGRRVNRTTGGIALLVLAGLMFLGFMRSNASLAAPATIVALLITAARRRSAASRFCAAAVGPWRRRQLQSDHRGRDFTNGREGRRKTYRGRSRDRFDVNARMAKETLDAMVARDVADIAVTEGGVIVYTFHDAKHIGGKDAAKGVLDD